MVVALTGSGGIRLAGPGCCPRSTWPASRHSSTVSSSRRRSNPAASSRGTGRLAGVAGAASRVRPSGEPAERRSSTSAVLAAQTVDRCGQLGRRSVLSSIDWPRCQGGAQAASAGTRNPGHPTPGRGPAGQPRQPQRRRPVRARRSTRSDWWPAPPRGRRRAPAASSTARCRKSRSSAATLTDCRELARAASAAMLPGAGWARSGRSVSRRISRSSDRSANQDPSGTLIATRVNQRSRARVGRTSVRMIA